MNTEKEIQEVKDVDHAAAIRLLGSHPKRATEVDPDRSAHLSYDFLKLASNRAAPRAVDSGDAVS